MKQFFNFCVALLVSLHCATAQSDCDTVSQLPWNEGFETGDAGCWLFVDNDGDGRNWTVGELMQHTGTYSLLGTYSPRLEDNWAISRPIALPAEAYGINLTWEVYAHGNYQETYEVLVSTGIRDSLNEYDSLFGETVMGGYHSREVSLDDYRGQVVHIAFRHRSQNQNFISIDDIEVGTTNAPPPPPTPTVVIESPDSAMTHGEVTFVARTENAESCTWSLEGATTTEATGLNVTTSWNLPGTYAVSATATGAGGSATATKYIIIYEKAAINAPAESAPAFHLYPNPTTGSLHISGEGIISLALIDAAGRIVQRQDSPTPDSSGTVVLDIDRLPSGTYTVQITGPSGRRTTTVVKK